jgi:hypothetical protein
MLELQYGSGSATLLWIYVQYNIWKRCGSCNEHLYSFMLFYCPVGAGAAS